MNDQLTKSEKSSYFSHVNFWSIQLSGKTPCSWTIGLNIVKI
jgi:hypothetical protein